MEVDASFQPFLSALNGGCTAREVVDRYIGGSSGDAKGGSGLEALTQGALRQGANELLRGMLQRGFLVERQG
jgi:hypothetical protein